MTLRMTLRLTTLFVILILWGCGSKSSHHDKAASDGSWKEMDDFHMVMAETFHPYKDSSDLQPVKSKAAELVASADKWANSPIPEKVDNDLMKEQLQMLKSETEILADIVQKGDDQAIGDQLTKVHNLFHKIQEGWYGNEEHEHHDH